MSNLRVALARSTIDPAFKDHTHSNSSAHRDVDHAGLRLSASPIQFVQRGGIGVVFQAAGTPNSWHKNATGLPPFHPQRLCTSPSAPVGGSTCPVQPIPIPRSRLPARTALWQSRVLISRMAWSNPRAALVGTSAFSITRPLSSTTPSASFVPPISTAPIKISHSPKRKHCAKWVGPKRAAETSATERGVFEPRFNS